MKQALRDIGIEMSEWKIRRIMRENGLYPVQLRKFKPGKHIKPDGRYFENKVRQEFNPTSPNEKWVGDITYLKTKLGWVYLAAVIDLYNREVIGYAVSKKIDAELAYQALSNAIASRGRPKALIFHSDRGCLYSSKTYQQMLEEYGIIGSMSSVILAISFNLSHPQRRSLSKCGWLRSDASGLKKRLIRKSQSKHYYPISV